MDDCARRFELCPVYFVPTGGMHAYATNVTGVSNMFPTWTSSKFTLYSRHVGVHVCVKTN